MSSTIDIEAGGPQLPQLVERVALGESITLTRGGVPIAMLVPPPRPGKMTAREAVEALLEFRKRHRLVGETVADLVREARGE